MTSFILLFCYNYKRQKIQKFNLSSHNFITYRKVFSARL